MTCTPNRHQPPWPYADKCQGNPASCRRKYVREEALEAQFTELLGRLKFDDEVLEWVRDALHASHADERREHEEAIKRHQAEYKRLNVRIHAMYVDKLDGVVDAAFFEKMSSQWREEQNRCQREIERHQNADKSYLDEGVALLGLARSAQRLFSTQEPREKRRLLNFVLSNCTWEGGEVVATFRQPFDMLAETATAAGLVGAGDESRLSKNEIWLEDRDAICFDFMPLDRFVRYCQRRDGASLQAQGPLAPPSTRTVPSGFAVLGWTDEEIRQWLCNGSAASGLG